MCLWLNFMSVFQSYARRAPQEPDSATETEVTLTEVTRHRACCVLRLKRPVRKQALKRVRVETSAQKVPCDEEMETNSVQFLFLLNYKCHALFNELTLTALVLKHNGFHFLKGKR